MIWFKEINLKSLNKKMSGTLADYLEIKFVDYGPDYLTASMPVTQNHKQPYGLLHGGASCVLAETLGSVAAHCVIDQEKYQCVGLEINANHLKAVSTGEIKAYASPLHIGKSTQVWEIQIFNLKLITCVSRLTVMNIKL